MKEMIFKKLGVAMGTVALTTVAILPQAHAELVFDGNAPTAPAAAPAAAAAAPAAAPQPVVVQAAPAAPTTTTAPTQSSVQQVVIPQQVTAGAANGNSISNAPINFNDNVDTQSMSKTELMRRARMREEVKNEDILQERLEELRLRDEQRRTSQLMATPALQEAGTVEAKPVQVQEQMVVTPITERPGTADAPASPKLIAAETPAPDTRAALAEIERQEKEEQTSIAVVPVFGMSSMDSSGALGYYNIRPRFSTGVGVSINTSESISLELGYTYSEYGMAGTSTNPAIVYLQQMGLNPSGDTLAFKQNVFDAGLKFHLLGSDSKIRPYVGAGGGYAQGYLNYDSSLRQYLAGSTSDYQVSQFLGYLQAGVDVKVSKRVSAGLGIKYDKVLSSRENSSLNPFGWGYGALASGNIYSAADQQVAGLSLANANFYSILGTVSFTF